ncbi:MAG: SDR family oxidoreductase [Cyclobacteriaceae bacterium]|jgi:NAD(P)-dependent dehydrogenase (short-subunit alcohol dehydrogenase family)|nr:SDR family oxidoreductase [Cytophagales bacterium]MCZ8328833.1 SDR family oxidoreductase [Cyclobacteriaceae bacterium]
MSKNILIVGASSGIGAALSLQLSQKGYQVFEASRSGKIKYDATQDSLDLSSLPSSLQGLIYCPGSINLKPFHRLSTQDFTDDFNINVLGAVRTIQQVLPLLKVSDSTSSIVLFSTVAVSQGMPFHASIASAKGAIEGLTKSLAAELAPKIRVNAIAPSLTDTPLAAKILGTEEKKKASAERHPLKKTGTPAELAALAAFLVSEEASFISGQIMGVDGGLSTLRA